LLFEGAEMVDPALFYSIPLAMFEKILEFNKWYNDAAFGN
jgi:hypothetical protein